MNFEWKLQDAKARFSEVVELALSIGPQHITRRGRPAVVIVSEEEYEQALRAGARKRGDLVALLAECPAPEIFDFLEEGRREPDFGRAVAEAPPSRVA